ncbi:MAG TPA: STAS domain-containing protein [Terriglobales bacterium]|nr:STAS domain-containing protein [Terriglobales bacterium]
MEIELRSQGKAKLVKLRGKVSLGESVDRLRETLNELMENGEYCIVVDLGEVPMVDSSGIGLLVKAMTAAKQSGGALRLLNPSKFVMQTLKMIGLLNLFEVFQDQQQAVESFH